MKAILISALVLIIGVCNSQTYTFGETTNVILYSTSYYSNGNCMNDPAVTVSFPDTYAAGLTLSIRIAGIDVLGDVLYNSTPIEVGQEITASSFDLFYSASGTVYFELIAIGVPEILGEEYNCSFYSEILGLSECYDFLVIEQPEYLPCYVQYNDVGITVVSLSEDEVIGLYDLLGNKITDHCSGFCVVLYKSGKKGFNFKN